MKKIFALFSLLCFIPTLAACQNTDLPSVPAQSAPRSSDTVSDAPGSTMPADSSVAPPDRSDFSPPPNESEAQKPPVEDKYEYVADIHEWADDNYIYSNGTYDYDDRYFADFERVDQPAVLWRGSDSGKALNETYDAGSAVDFAKAHWDDGLDLCAPFVSRCLRAGGLSISDDSSTALCLKLINSGLGIGRFVPVNADRTVTLPDYAAPGDVVQVYCPYEGTMNHTLIYVGNDENGHMKVCCHNSKNSGTYAFKVARDCYDCTTAIKDVFFFHFYGENEEKQAEDDNVLLSEDAGYVICNESYDRMRAAEYAKNNPMDGVGKLGAQHTSDCLFAGGILEGYPFHSALFIQLLRSRLGTAYSVAVNNDRTVYLPDLAEEGDACFVYCPDDGIFFNSFIIKGADAKGKMLAYSYDKLNSDRSAFKVESICPGCGGEVFEVMIYHFDD